MEARRLIGLFVYLILVALGFQYLWQADAKSRYCGTSWWEVSYLASQNLVKNQRLSPQDLHRPKQRANAGAPISDDVYLGKYLINDIKTDCPVHQNMLRNTPALSIAKGKTLWPYSLQDQHQLAPLLRPGRRVEIHGLLKNNFQILKDLRVLAVLGQNEQLVVLFETSYQASLFDNDFINSSMLVFAENIPARLHRRRQHLRQINAQTMSGKKRVKEKTDE